MKKIIGLVLLVLAFVLVGCQSEELKFGKKLVKVDGMIDILTEISSKTSDVGIMDVIMANYYMSKDASYGSELMILEGVVFKDENYGVASRKEGAYTAAAISNAMIDLMVSGEATTIANKYGLASSLIIDENSKVDLSTVSGKADYDYIIEKGELVIGYTLFAPIAFNDENNKLVGFDIDLAKKVCEALGVTAKFQLINWSTKEFELSSKTIDVIWNGMTITEQLLENVSISIPYLKNQQVAVIRKADVDKYKSTADMKDATIAVEAGSAGQSCVEKSDKE